MEDKTVSTEEEKEIAVVAALLEQNDTSPLDELCALCDTAGATVVSRIIQRSEPTPATLFGKGKVEEIRQEIIAKNANLLVVDNELSGSQTRNLSDALDIKVLDRSGLILDIFAMRATSPEGKLQVSLAQLKYNLPRLIGINNRMSKFDGGIGMRGPGEQKLELDKRNIREQITDLSKKIDKLKSERDLRRSRRTDTYQKTVSLVGYTNAGKSTIMNLLSKSDVLAENKLFATLDPITRKVFINEKQHFLLTDTVGFIRNLPHDFISAFSSTLEEAKLADLLLIILDVSAVDLVAQYNVVISVLEKLKITDRKILVVFNKCDLPYDKANLPQVGDSIFISAKTGEGVVELKNYIVNSLYGGDVVDNSSDK